MDGKEKAKLGEGKYGDFLFYVCQQDNHKESTNAQDRVK